MTRSADRSGAALPAGALHRRPWPLVAVIVVTLVMVCGFIAGLARGGLTTDGVVLGVGNLPVLVVASILVLRVPENAISWVLLLVALGLGTMATFDQPGWLAETMTGIALFGLVLPGIGVFVPLWFPTGRALTPRWRWVPVTAGAGVVGIFGGFTLLALTGDHSNDIDSCASVGACANIIGLVMLLVAVVAAIVSLVVRWIRSRGVERLQMKWLVLAFAVLLVGVLAEFGGFQYSLVANVFLPAGLVLVPVAIGVAVLRYRLYEIDRVISRTVAYVIVIALLGVVYTTGVTLLTSILPAESPLAVAAATLVVAALFNPLRRRVQGWVDRRFNRSRYDAQKVMEGLTSSLQGQIDQHDLVVVNETMQPTAAGVWVRGLT